MVVGGPMTILGGEYLSKLWRNTNGRLKNLAKPLLKDGIGDRMDRGNLWVVPGFTILVFAVLWATKLSRIALEESTCKGASVYDLGQQLDDDARRHCQTAKRYYKDPSEAFSYDPRWREAREVKNPEWILWFWAPIVFIMYVLTRFMWSLLLENQGINFSNVVNSAQSVTVENDDEITEVDDERLGERLPIIAENFRCAYSSRAFTAFVTFELSLVIAPIFLLLFILPLMIGGRYRSWGLDVAKAWWEKKEWQGSSLSPFFDFSSPMNPRTELLRIPMLGTTLHTPLIPRVTYCDYEFVTLGNSHTLTYRCYLDANWHERTALFTWFLLVFLSLVNFGNLFFWLEWAARMRIRSNRRKWVTKKWLNPEGFSDSELDKMGRFAETFTMSQLLLFYYVEAHTDRVVASAFCTALFARWLEKRRQVQERLQQQLKHNRYDNGEGGWDAAPPAFTTWPQSPIPHDADHRSGPHQRGNGGNHYDPYVDPEHAPLINHGNGGGFGQVVAPVGWNVDPKKQQQYFIPAGGVAGDDQHLYPTAPPYASGGTPYSTTGAVPAAGLMAAAVGMPETGSPAALIGRSQGRLPNTPAEVGRDSCYYCRSDAQQPMAVEDEEEENNLEEGDKSTATTTGQQQPLIGEATATIEQQGGPNSTKPKETSASSSRKSSSSGSDHFGSKKGREKPSRSSANLEEGELEDDQFSTPISTNKPKPIQRGSKK